MPQKTEQKDAKMQKKKEKSRILVGTRGRIFKGKVTKKFTTRVVIEFERTVYVPKYERYYKKKTRLHAKLPENLNIEVGDLVKIQECRPLSKIIHFVVIEKIKSSTSKEVEPVRDPERISKSKEKAN